MAWEQPVMNESTRLAGADLSDNQYKFVKEGADGTLVKMAAVTDLPYGVQQNDAKQGEAVVVMRLGVSKLACSANVVAGNQIGTTAAGLGTAYAPGTDTTKYIAGAVVDGNGASGSLASVSINCLAPHRGA